MDRGTNIITIGGMGIVAYLLYRYMTTGNFMDRLRDSLSSFIPSVEGFSATPYWDVTRYSWGYGTQAPGATGTITRAQAFTEMWAHLQDDYNYLAPLITRPLTINQWTAYLSFAYNEGDGNADNLVSNINSGDNEALGIQWNKYIYAGGKVNDNLVERRPKEWALWNS